MRMRLFVSIAAAAILLATADADGSCTTILVGDALTADGAILHAHNEDMGFSAVGRLWSVPKGTHEPAETIDVPYARIPQAPATHRYWASGNARSATGLGVSSKESIYDNVLVGMNEWGVTLSCNWMWSREENREKRGLRRYAIRQLVLERATSAQDAVRMIGAFIDEHGQADWGGLAYCLADPKEAWIVETTTSQWVARRIRADEMLVIANRFTIEGDFDLSSKRLLEYATEKGWHDPAAGPFVFRRAYGRPDRMNQAYDIDREKRALRLLENKKGAIRPDDLFLVLRDRYEGTPQYTTPLTFENWREASEEKGVPRTICTNLCQSSFVAHLRADLPTAVGALMWYTPGAPNYGGYFPLYAGATRIPDAFSRPSGDESPESAWWIYKNLQKAGDRKFKSASLSISSFWAADYATVSAGCRDMEKKAVELIKRGEDDKAVRLLDAFTFARAEKALYHTQRLLTLLSE